MSSTSYWNLHKLLKDETRRRIIQFIASKGQVTYTDILRELGTSTGKLNYHLKLLSPLIDKRENEQYYVLNDLGRNAISLLEGLRIDEENANGKKAILAKATWILLALSLLAMYYALFGTGTSVLGFASTGFLILAAFAAHNSGMIENFKFRDVLVFSLFAVAFGAPTVRTAQWIFMASNPFHASLVLNPGISLVNSAIFFTTFLAWSLTMKGRKEWSVSTTIISIASIFAIVAFLIGVAIGPNGFASLFTNFSNCTSTGPSQISPGVIGSGTACSESGTFTYVWLQPAFLLLTVLSSKVWPDLIKQGSKIKRH